MTKRGMGRGLAAILPESGIGEPQFRHVPIEMIAGERRWRAARQAKLETVPALIRNQDEAERLQTALIENMAREDLNPVDEARACAALVEELGLSKKQLAPRLG